MTAGRRGDGGGYGAAVISKRKMRAFGGRLLRRMGAVPGGAPDGLGEDARLLGSRLAQRVIVYFPETPTNLYQLRQWYAPLAALDQAHPVVVVTQDSRVARAVRAETDLAVICVARSATLDDLLSRSDVRLMLYVSHHPANFQALRTLGLAHVYLTHGDSDKLVSVSNQLKAYDATLVAGQAAIDRAAAHLFWYDAQDRMIPVGRPQLDALSLAPTAVRTPGSSPLTVLYAPTWEGAQPSTAYSSLAHAGSGIVRSVLEDGGMRLIYRPHPRTGARSATFAELDSTIKAQVRDAARQRPQAGHLVDTDPSPLGAMTSADVLVCDISAMALDWLATGRPLVVTEPASPAAVVSETRIWEAATRLTAADAARAAAIIRAAVTDDLTAASRADLARYYLGAAPSDTAVSATERFVAACGELIARRDAAVAKLPVR